MENNETITMSKDQLNEVINQAVAQAVAQVNAPHRPLAPTELGRTYHAWRAERDANAAAKWNELADASPFGGGLCRFFGSIASGLAEHHANGGFFSR